jgi:crotonobetainyl-CoA:carnitine CoA-transferase CaiB-like acyl-CoA transferase
VAFGGEIESPIIAVNTPKTIAGDPQFQHRLPWISRERLGADQLPVPIKIVDGELPVPTKAPTVGQHTDEVVREVLGLDDSEIAKRRAAGAFG